MSNLAIISDDAKTDLELNPYRTIEASSNPIGLTISARITKAASQQTYYTIRYLVDRNLTEDAYRAYAYFRWLDDTIDQKAAGCWERILFVERQKALIDCAYQGDWPSAATLEEQMMID